MSIMWMRRTHWQSVLPQKEVSCSTECRNFGRRTLFTAHWKIIENRQRPNHSTTSVRIHVRGGSRSRRAALTARRSVLCSPHIWP
jgi:hypothetical protein